MNESLTDMLQQDQTESTFPAAEPELDSIPEVDAGSRPEPDVSASAPEGDEGYGVNPVDPGPAIGFVPLADWFDENIQNFESISPVRLQIRGVNPKATLVVTVMDASGEVDDAGNPKKNLEFIKNADTRPVLNLPGRNMEIYGSGFKIDYDYENGQIMKCYGSKAGMVVTFCVNVNDMFIPYTMIRAKSKDKGIDPDLLDTRGVADFLPQPLDKEAFVILYKQSAKVIDELNTNEDAIRYLLSRQETITDNNHHIQIDNVIITMLDLS